MTNEVADAKKNLLELDTSLKNDFNTKLKQTNDEITKSNSNNKKIIDDLSNKFDSQQTSIAALIEKDKEMYNQIISTKNSVL